MLVPEKKNVPKGPCSQISIYFGPNVPIQGVL